jgi:hypothetical protein
MCYYLKLVNLDPGPVQSFSFVKLRSGDVFKCGQFRYEGGILADILIPSVGYTVSTGFDEAFLLYSLPSKATALAIEYLIGESFF